MKSEKEKARVEKRIKTKSARIKDSEMITLIFQILVTSGARLEEIIGLWWGDIKTHNEVLCYDFNRVNIFSILIFINYLL